jgi:hypothetical protein
MRINIPYAGFGLALLIFSHHAAAQELALDDFVRSILKNNPGVQRILADKAIAAGALESSQGVDDGILSSSLSLAHSEPNQVLGFEASQSDDTRLNLAYDRQFSTSGTRLNLSYGNQYTDRTPPVGTLGEQYYQPSFTVRLTQPLLKNAGGIQDSLDINLKQLNLKLAGLSSEENLESYITQLARLYLDWYLAACETAISKEVHQQSIEQEKLTRIKVTRQVIEPYELLRAQETREDYYSRWLQSQGRYLGLSRQIQRQMNSKQYDGADKIVPVNPAASQLFTSSQPTSRSIYYLASTSRLKNILDTLQNQQQLLLDAKYNAKQSDLNLSLGYTRHGIDSDLNDAHTSNLKQDDYSVMLEYRYPLGNKRAGGDYQAQLASKHQLEADTQQRMIDAESSLANLQEQETQLVIALKSIDRKIALATKKLTKEQRLYKIGKLDLFELLRDQTAHLESRLQKEQLMTRLLTLRLNIGELLDRNLSVYTATTDATSGK